MPKKSILSKNKKTIIPVSARHEKIYKYLRDAKEPKNYTQISKAVNIPASTVRRIIQRLIEGDNKFEYSGYYYTIVYQHGGFIVNKEPKHPSEYNYAKIIDEKETAWNDLRLDYLAELIDKRVTTSSQAEIVTQTVVLYKVTKKYYVVLEKMLRSLFTDRIFDIVPCDCGLYIILVEGTDLELNRTKVCQFYADLIANKKISKDARRAAKYKPQKTNDTNGS